VKLLLVLVLCAAGCAGGDPTGPSPVNRLNLHPGPYSLWLNGLGISTDPSFPVCSNAISIIGGTSVTIPVDLTNESGTWVVKSTPVSAAQMEFRFQEGRSAVATVPVTGTIRGTAVDRGMGTGFTASGVSVTVRGASMEFAQVEAEGSTDVEVVSGTVSGDIEFVDIPGHRSKCSKILLDLTLRVP
jgi:hypothetical protein